MHRTTGIRWTGVSLAVVMLLFLFSLTQISVADDDKKCHTSVQVHTSKNIGVLWVLIDGKQMGSMQHYRGLKSNKYARVLGEDPDRYGFQLYTPTPTSYSVTIKKPDIYVAGEGKHEGEVLLTFDVDIEADYSSLEIVFKGWEADSRRDKVYRKD